MLFHQGCHTLNPYSDDRWGGHRDSKTDLLEIRDGKLLLFRCHIVWLGWENYTMSRCFNSLTPLQFVHKMDNHSDLEEPCRSSGPWQCSISSYKNDTSLISCELYVAFFGICHCVPITPMKLKVHDRCSSCIIWFNFFFSCVVIQNNCCFLAC